MADIRPAGPRCYRVDIYLRHTSPASFFDDPISTELEAARTGLRLASAFLAWWLFKDVLSYATRSKVSLIKHASWISLLPFIATLLFLSVPVLIGSWNLPNAETRLIFGLSSFPVGLREEIIYRGLLLVLIAKRFGFLAGLVVSTLAFTFYHYGALAWTTFNIIQYIAAGILLGVLFWITRSLWLVIWIHTIYDIIWCYTPLLPSLMKSSNAIPIFAIISIVILIWFEIYRQKNKNWNRI